MADGVVIPLDVDDSRAKSKVASLKRDAAEAGRAYAKAGQTAARMGGVGGGAIGRAFGGFAGGIGMGVAGAAVAGVGIAASIINRQDSDRMEIKRGQIAMMQDAADMVISARDKRTSLAAGAMSYATLLSRAAYRGADKNSVTSAGSFGDEMGLTEIQTLETRDAAASTGVNSVEVARGLRTGMLGVDASGVAEKIKQAGGLHRALAIATHVSPKQATADLAAFESSPLARSVMEANIQQSISQNAKLKDITEGRTRDAVFKSESNTVDPLKKITADAARRIENMAKQMASVAAEQSWFGGFIADLGSMVGGEGSEANKLKKFNAGNRIPN